MNEIKNLKINGVEYDRMYSSYTPANELVYAVSPERASDFSLNNNDIDVNYIPNVSFTFNYIDPDLYSQFVRQVNTKGFTVEYYDYEIQTDVKRRMYMSEKSMNDLHTRGRTIKGMIGLSVSFVSKFGYESYDDLIERATNDERVDDDK